jgi:hypothetical protein
MDPRIRIRTIDPQHSLYWNTTGISCSNEMKRIIEKLVRAWMVWGVVVTSQTFHTYADMLVRYPCMREDDLCDLLKFDKKILRAKLATLKSDRFVQVKLKIETGVSNCHVICNVSLSFKHKELG